MKRLLAVAAVAATLTTACQPDAKAPVRDAYRVVNGLNNGLALSLDATAIVKRGDAQAEARALMARCPDRDTPCREQAVRDAMGRAQSAFDKIDAAAKLQHRLAETLQRLERCGAEQPQPDGLCEKAALAAALDQIPKVIEAIKAVKQEATNASAPQQP